MRILRVFLRRRPRVLARLAGWSVLEALPAILSGQAVARAVDRGFLAGDPAAGLGWLGLLAAAVLVGAIGTRRTFRCLADLAEPLRDELVAHVVTGTLRRAAVAGGGVDRSAVARLTHQVEIVRDTFAGLIMTTRGFLFAIAGALLGLASLAPVVALLVAVPLLTGLVLFAAAVPRMAARQRAYVLADEDLAEHAGRAFAGLRDIAACGAGHRMAAEISVPVDAQAAAERAVVRMTAARGISLAVGGWLPLAVVLAAAPWLVDHGLTAGAILGSLTYLLHGVQPALTMLIGGLGGGGVRLVVTLDRILRGGGPEPVAHGGPAARPDGADVLLRGVTFAYGRRAEPVVSGLDLEIRDGDHLAIIGPSGIGKSTLVGLLAGTLQPQQGEVRLGGARTNRLDVRTLARQRVLIPQEAYVFTGTLLDNLRYLHPGADVHEIDRAAEAVGLSTVLQRLGGYDAYVTPDALSAGERQLVALVRAYLSPAPLVLLDEATCHLDAAAEARAEQAFAARPGALVVVAHRVSSALRASRILLLDGTAATLGTDGSLRRTSPLYRDLAGHWSVELPVFPARSSLPVSPAQSSQPASSAMRTASNRLRAPVLRRIAEM
ncbi:ATP-binding cassette domain-containing protein [Couchioplanes caeruleus]|uniref:ATP-binding cassette subfamily C protein n=2 Tax=Couchioplanes caeruleus TaxID=56438 RepID=A0A3N1GEJ5_9ACTN|nr:ABC transporter ATP-binding protein [Couchioplanes caeruleus]ROP28677.1 ATP-binding cassette subfamily C protein [Couchioplanes caeruleus]